MKDGTGTKWEQIEAYGYSKPSNTVSLMSNTGNAIPSKERVILCNNYLRKMTFQVP